MKKSFTQLTPWLIALAAMAVLIIGINRPLTGQHDWNSVVYANIARIITRHGLDYQKLGAYFFHYPPLLPLALTLNFKLFGISAWSTRLVAVLSSALLVFFLYKLSRELWHKNTALLTSVFLVFSPMLLYYSKIPVHETLSLGFIAASVWFYLRWLKEEKTSSFYSLLVSLLLAQLTSWAGFYLSLYLPLHAIIFQRSTAQKRRSNLALILLLAFVVFALHLTHMLVKGPPGSFASFFNVFLFRFNRGEAAAQVGFSYSQFFTLQLRWLAIYFTRIMLLLISFWGVRFLVDRLRKRPVSLPQSFILLWFIFGFTHNVIFRNLAFIHDYMLIYALPFFAVGSAVALEFLFTYLSRQKILARLMVILFLILFLTERVPYTVAFFNTTKNNPAYPLGLAINNILSPEEKILILSPQFMAFYDVFLIFYADRMITPAASLSSVNIDDFDYAVIPQTHDYVTSEDKEYLYSHFASFSAGGGVFFNLKKPQ
ncbi:MAG: glycosyltransferase family 39 protein [Candidatus Chisholmbacteria bacterium]|nr:glycosyltransferase family 39 protein [Candidatus Chisholmbacteria bacterium]